MKSYKRGKAWANISADFYRAEPLPPSAGTPARGAVSSNGDDDGVWNHGDWMFAVSQEDISEVEGLRGILLCLRVL